MNPWLSIPGLPPGKFRVGQKVRLLHMFRGMIGEIVEDRGPIGVGRRRIYGVKVDLDPWKENPLELPEESLEAVEDDADSISPTNGKDLKG